MRTDDETAENQNQIPKIRRIEQCVVVVVEVGLVFIIVAFCNCDKRMRNLSSYTKTMMTAEQREFDGEGELR